MNIFNRLRDRSAPEAPNAFKGAYDVIVIGAGHNGLICAAYLADAGLDVLVVDQRDKPGGMASSELIDDRYTGAMGAHIVEGLSAKVARDLKLHKFGLDYVKRQLDTVAIDGEGQAVRFGADMRKSQDSISALSPQDAQAYPVFMDKMQRYTQALTGMLSPPPLLENIGRTDAMSTWLKGVRHLDQNEQQEFVRLCLSSVGDILDEYFESDLLKAALAFDGIQGGRLGPRDMGTMAALLWRWAQREVSKDRLSIPKGGMDTLAMALLKAAQDKGVAFRSNADVKALMMEEDQVTGISLDGDEHVYAKRVVSSADPKRTLMDLTGPRHLDTESVRRLKHLKTEGTVSRMLLTLNGMPFFTGLSDDDWGERILICPHMDYAQRSSRAMKYNELPHELTMEIVIPTVFDPTLAEFNRHIVSANIQYTPCEPEGGWQQHKEHLATKALDTLSYCAPNLRGLVEGGDLWTPSELASHFGSTGGHWHHVDHTLDQAAMMRPIPGAAQYHTPVPGLYLCGAGTHPGGGVTGLPGYYAAQRVIFDTKTNEQGGGL